MITDDQREELKIHLKTNYITEVLEELKKQGVTSRNSKPYSESMISRVFNGFAHEEIEDAIFKVYADRKAKHLKKQALRNQILSA